MLGLERFFQGLRHWICILLTTVQIPTVTFDPQASPGATTEHRVRNLKAQPAVPIPNQ